MRELLPVTFRKEEQYGEERFGSKTVDAIIQRYC